MNPASAGSVPSCDLQTASTLPLWDVRSALVVGQPLYLIKSLARLLHRAGFTCDVVTDHRQLMRSATIRNVVHVTTLGEWVSAPLAWRDGHDGLIVITNDYVNRVLLDADIDDATRCRLLSITAPEHLGHVDSKVGLARALERGGIPAPRFRVATVVEDIPRLCDEIGYPLLIKVDASTGGTGVFECRSRADADVIAGKGFRLPLLIQEKIHGEVIDLSGFYRGGKLIHFSYARLDATVGSAFGPSSVRTYTHLSEVERPVFDELVALGCLLGIDGFTNITCIQSAHDGRRAYFEVDLRPNVWVEYSRYLGDDPAAAIRDFFDRGTVMQFPRVRPAGIPPQRTMPYVFRLRAWEILVNRHGAWRYLTGHSAMDIVRHMVSGPARRIQRLGSFLDGVPCSSASSRRSIESSGGRSPGSSEPP